MPSSKGKAPAFVTYARDFLVDTGDVSLEAAGLHARLRAWSWLKGPVPLDRAGRARAAQLTPARCARLWDEIAPLWTETPAGFVDKGLEERRGQEAKTTELQSRRGQLGAEARWRKHRQTHASGNGQGNASSMRDGWPGDGLALAPALASADPTQNQEHRRERGGPVENDRENHFALVKIAHLALDDVEAGTLDPAEAEEQLERTAAKAEIVYAGDRTRKAFAAAVEQRRRGGR